MPCTVSHCKRGPLDGLELCSSFYHRAVANQVAPGWTRRRRTDDIIKSEGCWRERGVSPPYPRTQTEYTVRPNRCSLIDAALLAEVVNIADLQELVREREKKPSRLASSARG